MSVFNDFVREKGLQDTGELYCETERFISFIAKTYKGPLYTRSWDELEGYYKRWRKKEKDENE